MGSFLPNVKVIWFLVDGKKELSSCVQCNSRKFQQFFGRYDQPLFSAFRFFLLSFSEQRTRVVRLETMFSWEDAFKCQS